MNETSEYAENDLLWRDPMHKKWLLRSHEKETSCSVENNSFLHVFTASIPQVEPFFCLLDFDVQKDWTFANQHFTKLLGAPIPTSQNHTRKYCQPY